MKSVWSDREAETFVERYVSDKCNRDIALRVYSSRLLGSETCLVQHGGGNTSVKTSIADDLGRQTPVLCIKASGRDLDSLEPIDLPALRIESIRELYELDRLDDRELINAVRIRMLDSTAPNPSVEALLHAFLPHKYIDHSHADAVLAVVDQEEAEKICREIFEDRLALVPYVRSGFSLAKKAAQVYRANPQCEGLLLVQHGLVTFAESARESYERHIETVDTAESFCRKRRYWVTYQSMRPVESISYIKIAPILRGLLSEGGRNYILCPRQDGSIRQFVDNPKLLPVARRGVATPDHVIRTKRSPLFLSLIGLRSEEEIKAHVEQCLKEYRASYNAYVEKCMAKKDVVIQPSDPDPRIILAPGLGLIAAGPSLKDAQIAADIFQHTIEVMQNAEAIGAYRGLAEEDSFDIEYWSLEQAKLGQQSGSALEGKVVYITGAASGIGAATAYHFARAGACLYLVDRVAEPLEKLGARLGCAFEVVDVTDEAAVRTSIDGVIYTYGGLDGAISNAGYAPQSPIDSCPAAILRESVEVNFFAHQWVSSHVTRVLRSQGRGGFLLYNASKAAFNPGEGFGPYAIAKAALVALMKQYALEGGKYGIRSNAVNADRIRTGLFSEALIEERANARGIRADDYFRANLLGREVTADDVAQAFISLALAQSTTGCVITVDGGNIAASPR
ncbi:MAG: bifunctional aldolase/short-chain dehydrogenase [Deltaproteobacteria bacterium]|nr:bifunctional aldolase/short-chain dehydrogenase [Deltaproteobacteria bacterium]